MSTYCTLLIFNPSFLLFFFCTSHFLLFFHRLNKFTERNNAPINVNPVGAGGGGVRAREGDLMPGTIPAVGLLIV